MTANKLDFLRRKTKGELKKNGYITTSKYKYIQDECGE